VRAEGGLESLEWGPILPKRALANENGFGVAQGNGGGGRNWAGVFVVQSTFYGTESGPKNMGRVQPWERGKKGNGNALMWVPEQGDLRRSGRKVSG